MLHVQGSPAFRHWPGWLYASGIALLLLVGVVTLLLMVGVPASASDATPRNRAHPTLTTLLPGSPELAPPSVLALAHRPPVSKLSVSWLPMAVALLGWGSTACAVCLLAHQPSRFPPGRRGRALLLAYLN